MHRHFLYCRISLDIHLTKAVMVLHSKRDTSQLVCAVMMKGTWACTNLRGRYDDGDFTDVRAWCVYDGDVTSKVTGLSRNRRDRAK